VNKKIFMLIIVNVLLLSGTIFPTVLADDALTNERYRATGKYGIVAGGVSA